MRVNRRGAPLALGAFACAVVVAAAAGGEVAHSASSPSQVSRVSSAKLDSRLALVADTQRSAGRAAAVAAGERAGLSAKSGSVRVVVISKPGAGAQAKSAVEDVGGAVEASAGDLSDALVPPAALVKLANDPSVVRVRPPFMHSADAVDEGVHLADADTWHTAGFGGTGVKIAVIDLGFGGYSSLLGS
ncbi:MAG TPA: hypothetical protein VNR59_10295, partial [Gaiellaceae bacterium]|nr:hypothetical protein [Gaiellaceae bacterium]